MSMTIGDKINYLREQNNMTLEELGNKVGVGKSTIRKWEKGMIVNMKRDKIKKLADALGVSPSYLMGWTEEEYIQDSIERHYSTSLASLFINLGYEYYYVADAYHELPPEGKEELVNYIDYLVTKHGIKDKILNKEEADERFLKK